MRERVKHRSKSRRCYRYYHYSRKWRKMEFRWRIRVLSWRNKSYYYFQRYYPSIFGVNACEERKHAILTRRMSENISTLFASALILIRVITL